MTGITAFNQESELDSLLNQLHFLATRSRLNAVVEKLAQSEFESALINSDFTYEREYRLSDGDIVDFVLQTSTGLIAVELKLKAKRMSIFRQLSRYATHEKVIAVVLLTGTAMNLPPLIKNKPAAVISIGEAWL